MPSHASLERIFDPQALDALAMLHVFSQQALAARFLRRSDDQAVVEAQAQLALKPQRAGVQRGARLHPPHRLQGFAKKHQRVLGFDGDFELAREDVLGFLNHLEADHAVAVHQGTADHLAGQRALASIGRVE